MIIVKMLGGLGNQMFQVAYALYLAEKYNRDVLLDVSVYDSYKVRSFSLSNLCLTRRVRLLEGKDLSFGDWFKMKFSQKLYHVTQKAMKLLGFDYKFGGGIFRFLSKFGYLYNFDNYYHEHSLPIDFNRNIYIYGYFQSEKYFKSISKDVSSIFDLKNTFPSCDCSRFFYEKITESKHAIALSMRLGDDYLRSPVFNVCTESYFVDALDFLLSKKPDADVFVFSDDVGRAKNILTSYANVAYVEGMNDFQSLKLMSLCHDFVISNSSFSWWGAYLSNNNHKVIVAPDVWYNVVCGDVDIYLSGFVRYKNIPKKSNVNAIGKLNEFCG